MDHVLCFCKQRRLGSGWIPLGGHRNLGRGVMASTLSLPPSLHCWSLPRFWWRGWDVVKQGINPHFIVSSSADPTGFYAAIQSGVEAAWSGITHAGSHQWPLLSMRWLNQRQETWEPFPTSAGLGFLFPTDSRERLVLKAAHSMQSSPWITLQLGWA